MKAKREHLQRWLSLLKRILSFWNAGPYVLKEFPRNVSKCMDPLALPSTRRFGRDVPGPPTPHPPQRAGGRQHRTLCTSFPGGLPPASLLLRMQGTSGLLGTPAQCAPALPTPPARGRGPGCQQPPRQSAPARGQALHRPSPPAPGRTATA